MATNLDDNRRSSPLDAARQRLRARGGRTGRGVPEGGDGRERRHRLVITSYSIHYTKLYEAVSGCKCKKTFPQGREKLIIIFDLNILT